MYSDIFKIEWIDIFPLHWHSLYCKCVFLDRWALELVPNHVWKMHLRSIQTMQLCFVKHWSQTLLRRGHESSWRCARSSRNSSYPTLLESLAIAWSSSPMGHCPLFHGAKLHRLNALNSDLRRIVSIGRAHSRVLEHLWVVHLFWILL